MKCFANYFGGKTKLARRFGPPQREHVIEPFAGLAGYASYWLPRQVTLVEKRPDRDRRLEVSAARLGQRDHGAAGRHRLARRATVRCLSGSSRPDRFLARARGGETREEAEQGSTRRSLSLSLLGIANPASDCQPGRAHQALAYH